MNKKNTIAVGYVRVSTSQQVETGSSVDDQKNRIKETSKVKNYKLSKIYSDEGISGKSTERPSLTQMLKDAKEGKFEVIIFTKLDRLARNLRDTINIYHEADLLGITMICIDNPTVSTEGPMGRVMLSIMATFAEFERDLIRSRTNAGRMHKWKSGESFMGTLPFGYKKSSDTKKIEIDEYKKNIISKIFHMYIIEQLSMVDIAQKLTKDGYKTPSMLLRDKYITPTWNMNAVREILLNKYYTGEKIILNQYIYTTNKNNNSLKTKEKKHESEWIEMSFPVIIDKETFYNAQKRIEFNRVKPKNTKKFFSDKMLTIHILKCGKCKAKISRQATGTGKYIYYTCPWRKCGAKKLEVNNKRKCDLPYYNHEIIDNKIFNKIIDLVSDPEEYCLLLNKTIDNNDISKKIEALNNKKKTIQTKLVKLIDIESSAKNKDLIKLYKEERITIETKYNEISNEINNHKNQLLLIDSKNKQIENLRSLYSTETIGKFIRSKNNIKKILQGLSFDEKKKLVDAVIGPEIGGCVYIRPLSEEDFCSDDFMHDSVIDNANTEPTELEQEETKKTTYEDDVVIELDFTLNPYKISLIIQDIYKKHFNIDGL